MFLKPYNDSSQRGDQGGGLVGSVSCGIGEHFILGFRGMSLPAWLVEFERSFGLGGVILFDRELGAGDARRNIDSPAQLSRLCAEVRHLPSRPLVFIDQEGGRVRRLKPEKGFQDLPSAADFAKHEPDHALIIAERSFQELVTLGIDVNLAPVIDLNTNPVNPNIGALGRSFGADASTVRRCTRTLVEAARRAGLLLCVKHYPGLGGATTDSHDALTDLSSSISIEQLALFVDLGRQIPGGAVLLSHGLVTPWDPEWPTSLSRAAVQRLRQDLPDALLITDDLQMGGVQQIASTPDAVMQAMRAGADLVCIGNNMLDEEQASFAFADSLRVQAFCDPVLSAQLDAGRARVRARKQTSLSRMVGPS